MSDFDPFADEKVRTPYDDIADNTHDSARRLDRIETSLRDLSIERTEADRVMLNHVETIKMILAQIRDYTRNCFYALLVVALFVLVK
ncbi:MAG TPA: hypothetical protein VMA55_18880 [Acidovorax sp.]|nr:hypothetical protein [Acidovorax sp.]